MVSPSILQTGFPRDGADAGKLYACVCISWKNRENIVIGQKI